MLVEIVIGVRSGETEFNNKTLVLVDDFEQAESYALLLLSTLYPEAQKSSFGEGLWETPAGYPMWKLSSISEVTGITVRDLRENNQGYTRLEYTEVEEKFE